MSKLPRLKHLVEMDASIGKGYRILALFGLIGVGLMLFVHRVPVLLTNAEALDLTLNRSAAIETGGLVVPTLLHDWPYWFLQLNLLNLVDIPLRIMPLLFSFAGLVSFYQLLRLWFRRHDAVWGVLLLSTNIGFLLVSSSLAAAAGQSLLTLSLGLSGLTLIYRKESAGLVLTLLAIALGIYGGILGWTMSVVFLLAGAYGLKVRRTTPGGRTIASSLAGFMVMLSPLIFIAVSKYQQVWEWTDMKTRTLGNNMVETLEFIVVGTAENEINTVATWPLLSIAELALIGLALLLLVRKRKAVRYALTMVLIVISLLIGAVHGPGVIFAAIFLPLTTILVVAAGRHLRDQWHLLFPHNNAAQMVSRAGMYVLFGSIILLNLSRSFLFWDNSRPREENFIVPYYSIEIDDTSVDSTESAVQ